MYFIYVLYSEKDLKYYVGYSQDPWKRLAEHNSVDHPTFTSKYRPWMLKAVFKVGEIEGEAITLERYLKKQHSKQFIEKLISPSFIPNERLAHLIRVPHVRD